MPKIFNGSNVVPEQGVGLSIDISFIYKAF
jgi:hypothetical protein